jgi:hypothetical protein
MTRTSLITEVILKAQVYTARRERDAAWVWAERRVEVWRRVWLGQLVLCVLVATAVVLLAGDTVEAQKVAR